MGNGGVLAGFSISICWAAISSAPVPEVGVFRAFRAAADGARDAQAVFAASLLGSGQRIGCLAAVGDDLDDPGPVPQIQKRDPALVAVAVDPAIEGHLLSDLRFRNFAARHRAFPFCHLGLLHRAHPASRGTQFCPLVYHREGENLFLSLFLWGE